MLFNSIDFLIFFPIVLLIYWAVPAKLRQAWLLVASYFFYMCWKPIYILLILGSTIVTWASALVMEKSSQKGKRAAMIVCAVLNLGLLFFFKYFNFTLHTFGMVTGRMPRLYDIILPVGISFYTFQALGYTIDCYRGTTKAEHNFITYALFVSFFPQLVAGPIERSGNLLHQIKRMATVTRRELIDGESIRNGLILMAYGMFMKLVIADRVAILVDKVYGNIYLYGTVGLIMAFIGFGIQIYCDFGSYSMIAIGAARIMGVTLMENFDAPYLSTSIGDFWRRWHISLSSWFRDYVYIPLGGNRKGRTRTLINIFIVFLLSGLWHGASWTFVFWGALHGAVLVIENLLKPAWNKFEGKLGIARDNFGFTIVRALFVSMFVDFAWIFFRADTFSQAFGFIKRMFTRADWWVLTSDQIYTYGLDVVEMGILLVACVILVIVDFIKARMRLTVDQWLSKQFVVFRIIFMLAIVLMTILWGEYGPGFSSQQFIYFQF